MHTLGHLIFNKGTKATHGERIFFSINDSEIIEYLYGKRESQFVPYIVY